MDNWLRHLQFAIENIISANNSLKIYPVREISIRKPHANMIYIRYYNYSLEHWQKNNYYNTKMGKKLKKTS